METFDLTPDPKVLIALTHTPMQPLDALCELIDNSLDSFQAAELRGSPVMSPLVVVNLPKKSQVAQHDGSVRVRDNGTGLSPEMAEKALRAGFSGNNPYDSLGLFGMGFNISTGKLGQVTRFLTARQEDGHAIEVTVNLEMITRLKSYKVPVNEVDKPQNFEHGTLVEVSAWWPEGNPNKGFILKLIQYGIPRIREELGRRYSSILRKKKIQIIVNDESVTPFEHCIWDDSRFVERKGAGKVPAIFAFDEVVGNKKRCMMCTALVETGSNACQICGSSSMRTIEERIKGWVGIQRFDDPVEYGIDLIRNGRVIRISEKNAFFEFTDEFKRTIKDYPIDSPYGRIVGEVHLNHVPVDFLKQDFQRTTPEWQRAMAFLRGESSLQPTQPGADNNTSPVFKLYQGYRRVRHPGRADMYMGYWDKTSNEPKRISRDKEKEYFDKFRLRLPGYYEDAEWWNLVEQADKKPLDELIDCPACTLQNLVGFETCQGCGYIFKGKECLNQECKKDIPFSASSCPHCGSPQDIEIQEPWGCLICNAKNTSEAVACRECGASRGTLHPLSRDYLIRNSEKSDELSIDNCSVMLADGTTSTPLKVETYVTQRPITPIQKHQNIPAIAFKNPNNIEVFVDLSHRIFKSFEIHPEQMIAAEAALQIFDANRRLVQHQGIHSLATIQADIIQGRWAAALEAESGKIQSDIAAFFQSLRDELPAIMKDVAQDIYNDLPDEAKKKLVDNLLARRREITELPEMRQTGEFLRYLDEETVILLFRQDPASFFDGSFWAEPYAAIGELPEEIVSTVRQRTKAMYLNCLEDICNFLPQRDPEKNITTRARASLAILQRKAI